MEPLDLTQDLTQVKRAIKDALGDYPQSVLDGNLRSIGLANKLFFYGDFYGGTYSKTFPKQNSVYLSVHSSEENIDVYTYVQSSFYHEFSSILMHKYSFPEKEWREANPAGFKYRFESTENPGYEAMQQGINENEAYYAQGFLSAYSLAGLEEDFNEYSGIALTYPEGTLFRAKENPIIMKKLKIWLGFYLSIDPDFADRPTFKYLISQIKLD